MSLRGDQRQEFSQKVRKAAFVRCCRNGTIPGTPQCENCGLELVSGNIIYEHVTPDGLGGEPTAENCKVFCLKICATKKTVEEDNPRMAKADAVLKKAFRLEPARQKMQSASFSKAKPQRRASGTIAKWKGF
jgi:hypothetical protein